MRRLKLDYGSLRELNPRLIYCSISGYGQTGPSAELPAYAPVIHAASGYDMAHLSYQPGRARPDHCGIYHADVVTGVYAFGAIVTLAEVEDDERQLQGHEFAVPACRFFFFFFLCLEASVTKGQRQRRKTRGRRWANTRLQFSQGQRLSGLSEAEICRLHREIADRLIALRDGGQEYSSDHEFRIRPATCCDLDAAAKCVAMS